MVSEGKCDFMALVNTGSLGSRFPYFLKASANLKKAKSPLNVSACISGAAMLTLFASLVPFEK